MKSWNEAELRAGVKVTTYGPDHNLRTILAEPLRTLEADCRAFATVVEELKLGYLFKRFGMEWPEFCKQWISYPQEFVEAIISGVKAIGADFPIPLTQAIKVGREIAAAPELKQGKRNDLNELSNNVTKLKRGNQASYLAARLKRDHPDIVARLEAGEFPSIRAAAIAAGIIKVKTPLDDLMRAWAKASASERERFMRHVNGDGNDGQSGKGR